MRSRWLNARSFLSFGGEGDPGAPPLARFGQDAVAVEIVGELAAAHRSLGGPVDALRQPLGVAQYQDLFVALVLRLAGGREGPLVPRRDRAMRQDAIELAPLAGVAQDDVHG